MASEICTMRIVFPAESPEKAIEYKKKISELLADEPDARTDFNLMTMPSGRKPNADRPIQPNS